MQDHDFKPCDLLISYFADECSKDERLLFENHLHTCPSCRSDWDEIEQVWRALPWQMDQMEAPKDLKSQVMGSLFDRQPRADRWKKGNKPGMPWQTGLAAAVVLLVIIASAWNYYLFTGRSGTNRQALDQPAQVKVIYTLSPTASNPSATGKACIFKQGDQSKLVVYLFGLSATQGEEAYQVWLINDGKRQNAGTFHVNDQGFGVLTYDLQRSGKNPDAIGITLEPDPHGTEPRGTKVLGT